MNWLPFLPTKFHSTLLATLTSAWTDPTTRIPYSFARWLTVMTWCYMTPPRHTSWAGRSTSSSRGNTPEVQLFSTSWTSVYLITTCCSGQSLQLVQKHQLSSSVPVRGASSTSSNSGSCFNLFTGPARYVAMRRRQDGWDVRPRTKLTGSGYPMPPRSSSTQAVRPVVWRGVPSS